MYVTITALKRGSVRL